MTGLRLAVFVVTMLLCGVIFNVAVKGIRSDLACDSTTALAIGLALFIAVAGGVAGFVALERRA